MTTLEEIFSAQLCHWSAQGLGGGSYCFGRYLWPASCDIYERVAKVTESRGLCDVNVIQSDNSLQAQ